MCVGESFPTNPKNKSTIIKLGLACPLDQDRAENWTELTFPKPQCMESLRLLKFIHP